MRVKISKNQKSRPKNYIFGAVRRYNEVKKSKLLNGIPGSCNESIYHISTLKLNLKGSYARENLKEWENLIKNPHFRACEGIKWGWSHKPQKTYQEPVMNLPTKFQLPSWIWREVMREKYSKKQEKPIKKPYFWDCKMWWVW